MTEVISSPVSANPNVSQQTVSVSQESSAPVDSAPAEVQVEAPKEVVAEETPASRRLAEIARRERIRLEGEAKFKQEKAAFESEATKVKPILEALNKFNANPNDPEAAWEFQQATGIPLELLVDRLLATTQEEVKPELTVDEIVEKKLAEKEAAKVAEAEEARNNQLISDFRASIDKIAEDKSEQYKYLYAAKDKGSLDAIFDLAVEFAATTGQVLDLETAFKETDEYYKDKIQSEFEQLSKIMNMAKPAAEKESPKATKPLEVVAPTNSNELTKEELLRHFQKQLRSN